MLASEKITELTQQYHNERQKFEITLQGLNQRAEKLKPTNKFKHIDGVWQPQDYKGYAIVSMLDTNPNNKELSEALVGFQNQIQDKLQLPHHFYMMPQASFHQTVVNTLSGSRFKTHIIDQGLEENYPEIIQNALDKTPKLPSESPLKMNLIGIAIFGSAIGALGVIEDTKHWKAIMQLREELYSNTDLNTHHIKRTRPFIAHITLGYIDGELTLGQKQQLVQEVHDINTSFDFSKLVFTIDNTELRSYNHLAEFVTQPNYPQFIFCK
ncbi:hypothetical protein MHTCC0001_24720 [Flavobacteriaceae bacterium MHTCC 0001]